MISVCMATYNGGKFIREQLETILSQLPTDAEVIVADDGTTDEGIGNLKFLCGSTISV